MALSADAIIPKKEAGLQSIPVYAAAQIYKGGLVSIDTTGYARAGVDTIGYRFGGVAAENVLGGSSSGDKEVRCYTEGVFKLPCTGVTRAMVGQFVYLKDDGTVDNTSTYYQCVGRIVEYVSTTSAWVDIGQKLIPSNSAPINIVTTGLASAGGGYSSDIGLSVVAWAAACVNQLGVAGYFETHLTGTLAGTVYGFGSWINLEAAVACGSNMLCAQDNGIYGPTGLSTGVSSAKLVIGMRMELVLDDGQNPGSLFLFSTNIYDNALTAIFDVNALADLSNTTTKSGDSVAIPFVKIASSGTTYYINIYSS